MKKQINVKSLVFTALLAAIVIILQLLGAFVRFGPFSVSLVLIPIVIGAAFCGTLSATVLGFVFGFVVLISGDANSFLAVNPIGTVITVLAKGALCGAAAGLTYKLLKSVNNYLAIIVSAIVCPLVNTGIFLLGCLIFFMGTISEWAAGSSVISYMIFTLVGANFLFELGFNIFLSPAISRIIKILKK